MQMGGQDLGGAANTTSYPPHVPKRLSSRAQSRDYGILDFELSFEKPEGASQPQHSKSRRGRSMKSHGGAVTICHRRNDGGVARCR